MSKTKALIVTAGLSYGGATKRIILIKQILTNSDINTDIFTLRSNINVIMNKKFINTYNIDMDINIINYIKIFISLTNLIKNNKYKFVICNSRNLYPICKILSYLYSVKYICFVQIIYKNAPLIFKLFYADHVIAVSEGVKDYLIHKQKINESKITLIRNSSPPIKLLSVKRQIAIRDTLGVDNSFIISCIARFEPIKGHTYLLDAFKLLCKEKNNVKLLLMGYGEYKTELVERIDKIGIRKTVLFIHPNHNIEEIFSITDLLVLPSLREGLPTVVLEGFSAGRTIVATGIPGTKEIVKDGYNGLSVPVKDSIALYKALNKLILDSKLRIKFEKNAKKTYHEEFTYGKYEQNIITYFKTMADN